MPALTMSPNWDEMPVQPNTGHSQEANGAYAPLAKHKKIRLFTPYEIYMGETMLLSANLHHIKVIGNNNSTIEILPRLGSISPTALSKRSVLCVIEQEIADIK